MISTRRCFSLLLLLWLLSVPGFSQVDPTTLQGITSAGSYQFDNFDNVNLLNGNVMLNIPLYAPLQRGKVSLSFAVSGNNLQWESMAYCGGDLCQYTYQYGGLCGATGIGLSSSVDLTVCHNLVQWYDGSQTGSGQPTTRNWLSKYSLFTSDGSGHSLSEDSSDLTTYHSNDGGQFLMKGTAAFYTTGTDSSVPPELPNVYTGQGIHYSFDNFTFSVLSAGGSTTGPFTYPLTSTISDPNSNQIQRGFLGPDANRFYFKDSLQRVFRDAPRDMQFGLGFSLSTTGCPVVAASYQPLSYSYTWVVPGPQGQDETFLFCYAKVYLRTNFFDGGPGATTASSGGGAETVLYTDVNGLTTIKLQSVVLPNQKFWTFIYDSADPNMQSSEGYGDLKKVVTPIGGSISYQYATKSLCSLAVGRFVRPLTRVLTSRTIDDGAGGIATWDYQIGDPNDYQLSDASILTAPLAVGDTVRNQTAFKYGVSSGQNPACPASEVHKITYQGSVASNVVLEDVATSYRSTADPIGGMQKIAILPSSKTVTRGSAQYAATYDQYDSGFTAAQVACSRYSNYPQVCAAGTNSLNYDSSASAQVSYGLLKQESNFDVNADVLNDTPMTQNLTTYVWENSQASNLYFAANMLSLPALQTTAGTNTAKTRLTYDDGNPAVSGTHGNPTAVENWDNSSNSWVKTTTTYDVHGMPATKVDANGNAAGGVAGDHTTHITYDTTGSLITQIEQPATNGVSHIDRFSRDTVTGQVILHSDQNATSLGEASHTTSYSYDHLGRLTDVLYPPTQVGRSEIKTCYTDEGGAICSKATAPPYSVVTESSANTGPIRTVQTFDGLGRLIQKSLTNDPAGPDLMDTAYDLLGRVSSKSNPYRSTPQSNDPPQGKTTFEYDALGRMRFQYARNAAGSDIGSQKWTYSSNQTDFWDESLRHWQRITDGAGRLTKVYEPDPQSGLPTILTTYGYDSLGNLTSATQGTGASARIRSFQYDSLSRLTHSCNPESLTPGLLCNDPSFPGTTYIYYPNGTVHTKTDTRNITTTYAYDALNRMLSKTYTPTSNPTVAWTPSSCYWYDTPPTSNPLANATGLLTAEWSAFGGCASAVPPTGFVSRRMILGYDVLGRILKEEQCTPGNCKATAPAYTLSLSYDVSGSLNSYTNGIAGANAMTFLNQFDQAGRLESVSAITRWNDAPHPWMLFSAQDAQSYSPASQLLKWNLGTGITVERSYDARSRVTSETAKGYQQ